MTKEFGTLLELHELEAAPITDVIRVHGRDILIGAFVPLASFAMFHLVTIFPLGWMSLFGSQPIGTFLVVQVIGAMVGIVTIIASGLIADRIGRRGQLAVCAVIIAIFSFIGPMLIASGSGGQDAFVIIGFGVLGLSFGQATGSISSRFGRGYRYTGAALTSDLSWLVGAGFAPLVALSLSSRFGLPFVGYYLLSGAVCTLAALAFSKALEQRE
jgi:MFS family permease